MGSNTHFLSNEGKFMTTYRVKFITPGHMLEFRSHIARTPVTFNKVREEELLLLKSQALRSMLQYEITKEFDDQRQTVIKELEFDKEDKEIKIEELFEVKTPVTILEKLISEDQA